jgi:hypothetical protein
MRWTCQLGDYGLEVFKREARNDGPAFPVFLHSINDLEFGDRIDVVSPDGLGGYFRVVGIGVDVRVYLELMDLVDSIATAEINQVSRRSSGVYNLRHSVVVKDSLGSIVSTMDRVCQDIDVCPIALVHGITLSKPNGEAVPPTSSQGLHGPLDGDRTQVKGQIVPLADWLPVHKWVIGLPGEILSTLKRRALSLGRDLTRRPERRLSDEFRGAQPQVVLPEPRFIRTRSIIPPRPRLTELVTWPLYDGNSPGDASVSLPGRPISLRMEDITDITINDPSD